MKSALYIVSGPGSVTAANAYTKLFRPGCPATKRPTRSQEPSCLCGSFDRSMMRILRLLELN